MQEMRAPYNFAFLVSQKPKQTDVLSRHLMVIARCSSSSSFPNSLFSTALHTVSGAVALMILLGECEKTQTPSKEKRLPCCLALRGQLEGLRNKNEKERSGIFENWDRPDILTVH